MRDGGYWLLVGLILLIASIMLYKSIFYIRCGIYTKTFKGSRQDEYVYKNKTPLVYWFHVIFDLIASISMLYVGFWFLDWVPPFNELYERIRSVLSSLISAF